MYYAYLLIWGVTALVSAVLVRICISIAPKLGFLDIPEHEAHKRHRKSTPVLGGIGMMLAWLLVLLGGLAGGYFIPEETVRSLFGQRICNMLPGIRAVGPQLRTIVAGTVLLTILGAVDDKLSLKAWQKFLGQLLVAVLTAVLGLRISFLHQIPFANTIFTVLWFLTLMNAINFFDNMDGLACGAAIIASLFFMMAAAIRGQFFVAVLAALTAGATSGFAVFNAPPARIFMGDAGSHFLAYLLAILGILTTFYIPGESPTPAPIVIPLFLLAVPLFDAVAVVIIRLRLHKPIYVGDNRHISHRFEALGLSRKQAVMLVLLLCLAIACAGLSLLWLPPAGIALVALQTAAIFILISIIQFYVKKENQ